MHGTNTNISVWEHTLFFRSGQLEETAVLSLLALCPTLSICRNSLPTVLVSGELSFLLCNHEGPRTDASTSSCLGLGIQPSLAHDCISRTLILHRVTQTQRVCDTEITPVGRFSSRA